VLCSHLRKVRN